MANTADMGKYIRDLRRQMGLTQEKLAAVLGVSFSTLNRWENGRSKPSPLAQERIEHLLKQINDQDKNI